MDYKQKKMTKQQLWDKLHNERIMWQNKCEQDAKQAALNAIMLMKAQYEPILAAVVRALGTPDGDELRLDISKPEEVEGFLWCAKVVDVDDTTLRLVASLEPDPTYVKQEEEEEEQ